MSETTYTREEAEEYLEEKLQASAEILRQELKELKEKELNHV